MTIEKGTKRGKYKPKQLKFEHTCESCETRFRSADVKGRFCLSCKQPKRCLCGCGTLVKTPGHYYASGCNTRGKTYQEIYGSNIPACGFKTGVNNPMSNPDILESVLKKINKGKVYNGVKYRSSYEVEICKILNRNNIPFVYEPLLTIEGKCYKPDFVIDSRICIEVSGYASATEPGRIRNLCKIEKIENTYDLLIFITSGRFVTWYTSKVTSPKIIVLNYEELLKNNNLLYDKTVYYKKN